jgi:hypothetical protein
MGTARGFHCTVLFKKKAVVLGGHFRSELEIRPPAINSPCEEFDPSTRKWSPFPPLTYSKCSGHGACVLNDEKIFVCDGESVEMFDGVWSVFGAKFMRLVDLNNI